MIYIHIPYCRSFCTYCGFYSVIADGGFEAYVNALCREIVARQEEIPWEHNTLYIGGGTPSVLPLCALSRVVETLGEAQRACGPKVGSSSRGLGSSVGDGADGCEVGLPHFDEFTVEVNPDDIVRLGVGYVRGLASLGVNRISMGVQSLDDRVLKWMNRRHSASSAREAYRIIREGGIDNISVDLIFGFGDLCASKPDSETLGSEEPSSSRAEESFDSTEILEKTIEGFFGLGGDGILPRHISAYQLSIEEGSELAEMVGRGDYVPASDETCARQYEIICERLAAAGYHHYEISNFAQPGFEAQHNSAYWHHIPYIGFGPAAHSFFIRKNSSLSRGKGTDGDLLRGKSSESEEGSGVFGGAEASESEVKRDGFLGGEASEYIRRWNRPDLCAYLKAAETGDWDSISEGEVLTADQIREEKIMLALRTDLGIPASEIPHVENMIQKGLLQVTDNGSEKRLRIPENKFFISDSIISELF